MEEYICKYCGKICKNLNSLRNHEVRCKLNPDRKIQSSAGFGRFRKKIKNGELKSPRKGMIGIHLGNKNTYIKREDLEQYLNNGWSRGFSDEYRSKITYINQNKLHPGKSNTEAGEKLRRQRISETMKKNPKAGGRRQGSGRGKKGWYKGVFCDSSWELAFLIYCLEHNIDIKRCEERREYLYNGEKHIYLPDFVVDGEIIEIKGYKTKQWLEKLQQNPDIKVLYEADLKPYLDYVIDKYGKDYIRLYE